MKKIHIILLVLIAASIGVLVSFLKIAAPYASIAVAKSNPGKFVHVAAQLDKSVPLEYNAKENANLLSFVAIDSTGEKMKVIYRDGMIPNLEISDRIVLEGKYQDNHFECERVQTKCPSKYKDDMKVVEKNLQKTSESQPANTGTKY